MSEYTDEMDDNSVICPYCQHKYEPETEDFDEGLREEECDECGKQFWLVQEFSVTHKTTPDCEINEQHHKWDLVHLMSGRSHEFCETCGQCRPFSREQLEREQSK